MRGMSSSRSWQDALSTQEIRELRKLRDARSWLTIAVDWGLIAASMAMVAYLPNVFTVLLALVIIGTRQLGLAVIMHESAHHTLFKNRWLNDFAGSWLAAYPILLSAELYRPYHLQHHAKTWTEEDPDLDLGAKFPVSRASMTRKLARDLFGITGIKRLVGITYVVLNAIAGRAISDDGKPSILPMNAERGPALRMLVGAVVTNGVLFAILWAVGHPMLYLLWIGAYLTTHSVVIRIRSIAEHAVIDDPADPLGQTRTILANPLARLFIAPNRVYFHLEHHLVMTVPHYNLARMHEMLHDRGVLDDACVTNSYFSVLRRAVS